MQKVGSQLSLAACAPALALASLEVLETAHGLGSREGSLGLAQALLPEAEILKDGTSFMSVSVEIACFCIAFAVIRTVFKPRQIKGGKLGCSRKKVCEEPAEPREQSPLKAWRKASSKGPVSGEELQMWASRVFLEQPTVFVEEFVGYLAKDCGSPEHKDAAEALLDIPAKAGRPDLVEAFADAARRNAGVELDAACLHQALLSSCAVNGQTEKVDALLANESAEGQRVSAQSFATVACGYLTCGKLQEAIDKLDAMHSAGSDIPDRTITEIFQAACKSEAHFPEVFRWLDSKEVRLPSEAAAAMLEHCSQAEDLNTAAAIHASARRQGIDLSESSYISLLKVHAKSRDGSGSQVLESMLASGFSPCEGLCRFIIARCADSRNVKFAEALADFLRKRHEMTFATYKTLMKVYAFANMYDEACDLYTEVQALGMEPDAVMYGSLMKFAVKAGRTALAQEIFDRTEGGSSVQAYMWLIRAAGQEKDVGRAVGIFRRLQRAQPELVDAMAFNITLDACVSNQDMQAANELLEEMRQKHSLNLVTYNTLIKGHAGLGDVRTARKFLGEMKAAAIAPDSATFSCLLTGALRGGNFKEVWAVIDEMDSFGVPPSSYFVSIMMQAVRKIASPRDGDRLLAILDRPDVRIFQDEVVFNTVLDACIFRRDRRRLARVLEEYPRSAVQASIRTYGLLIKACSVLKRTLRCWDLWGEMVKDRGLVPNDVTLGCMIDALVEAQRVDEALALFQEWKPKVKCDTIIYSTLIKGFSSMGDAERAMALYKDMKLSGVQMNHIVYTALINAHTRNGLMKRAEALLEEMQKDGCQPNVITFSSLVKGHCALGDLQAALGLFQQMMDGGFKADTIIFNTLLDGCVQKGNWALGDELLAEMERLGVQQSNFTLSIMVKMWSKRGNLDKAFQCVYEALREPAGSTRVDAQVGACIVGACLHNRSPERAVGVFQEMKGWVGFDGPDANTYSALISGLPRHGFTRKAVQLAEEACTVLSATACGQDRRPLAPNALQQLFRALRQEGSLQELGLPLASKLRRAGMKVDSQWLA